MFPLLAASRSLELSLVGSSSIGTSETHSHQATPAVFSLRRESATPLRWARLSSGSLRVGSGHKGPSPRWSLRMEPWGWPADPEQSCKGQAGPDLSWKRRKPSEAEARAESGGHGNQQGQNQQEPSVFQESLHTRSPPFACGQRLAHRQFITAFGRQARTGASDQLSLTKLATSQRRWQTRSSQTTCAITARRICESSPGCSLPARIHRQPGRLLWRKPPRPRGG